MTEADRQAEGSTLARPNFRYPGEPIILNGYHLKFRRYQVSNTDVLWLPSYIVRNARTAGWLIRFKHDAGLYRGWVGDNGRPILKSLDDAWSHLVAALQRHRPPAKTVQPRRRETRKVDTGVAGVTVERKRGSLRGSHSILVRISQRIRDEVKGARTTYLNLLYVSELQYRDNPGFYEILFRRALCEATAIRQFYEEALINTGPLKSRLTLADVPPGCIPVTPIVELELADIFASFGSRNLPA